MPRTPSWPPTRPPRRRQGPPPTGPALTPEGAREFIAAAEKDLFDLNVISQHAAWANSTYINDDTDAMDAYFGTIGTEKGVQYAKEAARYAAVPGLDPDTARKLNILRGALVLAAPSTAGAAAELNNITTKLQSTYGKGRATHNGKTITGDDTEELMGTLRKPAELKEMWQSWHDNVGRPMRAGLYPDGRDRQRGRQGARLCRHRRDVALGLRHDRPKSFRAMSSGCGAR